MKDRTRQLANRKKIKRSKRENNSSKEIIKKTDQI